MIKCYKMKQTSRTISNNTILHHNINKLLVNM